jgi:hypothetical protein
VSCVSARWCTAVGSYQDYQSGAQLPLAEHWNGSRWAIQTAANPAGAETTELSAVSCVSASACIAVGSTDGGPLAERWNGKQWSIQTTPYPGNVESSTVTAVSCASPRACIAVGQTVNRTGSLIMHLDGNNWTLRQAPPTVDLTGVSCTPNGPCTIVGRQTLTGGTLAERSHGPI